MWVVYSGGKGWSEYEISHVLCNKLCNKLHISLPPYSCVRQVSNSKLIHLYIRLVSFALRPPIVPEHPSWILFNPLTPNDHYRGRTAPLTSKRCILYIYSTNICIEYFKYGIYFPFLSLQNAVGFIILTYLVPVLFTFYTLIQNVPKLKK